MILQKRISEISNVSDAYGQYGGINNYVFRVGVEGLHPDQRHELIMIPVNSVTGEFWVLNANDGGLGLSQDEGLHLNRSLIITVLPSSMVSARSHTGMNILAVCRTMELGSRLPTRKQTLHRYIGEGCQEMAWKTSRIIRIQPA